MVDSGSRPARAAREFFAPVPLAAVALLAANDHFLKAWWPGFVTGKLSDISGCFFLPLFLSAFLALGTHLYEQEYFDEAREMLQKAVARDAAAGPDERRQARMLLAIIEHVSHNFAEAEKLLKEALTLPPDPDDEPKLLFVLGRTQVSSGRPAEGMATFEEIVRQFPQSPIAAKARETLVNMRGR